MGYSYVHVNKNQTTHQWCELTMDGRPGYADGMGGNADYGEYDMFRGYIYPSPRDYALDTDLLTAIGEQAMEALGPVEFDRELPLGSCDYDADYELLWNRCLAPNVSNIKTYVWSWICEKAESMDMAPEEFLASGTFRIAVYPNEAQEGYVVAPYFATYIVMIVQGPEKGT